MKRFVAIMALCLALAACATKPPPAPDRVPLPPPPPPGEPASTQGMSAEALRAAFGAPAFLRKEGDAQMWRYDGGACHAFFFLYPENGQLTVRHVETVPRPPESALDPACLELLRKRPPAPAS